MCFRGGGQRSMVKDHKMTIFLGPFPYVVNWGGEGAAGEIGRVNWSSASAVGGRKGGEGAEGEIRRVNWSLSHILSFFSPHFLPISAPITSPIFLLTSLHSCADSHTSFVQLRAVLMTPPHSIPPSQSLELPSHSLGGKTESDCSSLPLRRGWLGFLRQQITHNMGHWDSKSHIIWDTETANHTWHGTLRQQITHNMGHWDSKSHIIWDTETANHTWHGTLRQ